MILLTVLFTSFLLHASVVPTEADCEPKLADADFIAAAAKAVRGALDNPNVGLAVRMVGRASVEGTLTAAVRVDYTLSNQAAAAMVYFRSREDGRIEIVDDGVHGLNLRPESAVIAEVQSRPEGGRVVATQTRHTPYGWQVIATIESSVASGDAPGSSETFEVYLKSDMTLAVMPVARD